MGYLMYLADAFGYLGYILVLLAKFLVGTPRLSVVLRHAKLAHDRNLPRAHDSLLAVLFTLCNHGADCRADGTRAGTGGRRLMGRAMVFSSAGQPLQLVRFPTPEPRARILVRITCCTLCRSDLILTRAAGRLRRPFWATRSPAASRRSVPRPLASMPEEWRSDLAYLGIAVGCGDCFFCAEDQQAPERTSKITKPAPTYCWSSAQKKQSPHPTAMAQATRAPTARRHSSGIDASGLGTERLDAAGDLVAQNGWRPVPPAGPREMRSRRHSVQQVIRTVDLAARLRDREPHQLQGLSRT